MDNVGTDGDMDSQRNSKAAGGGQQAASCMGRGFEQAPAKDLTEALLRTTILQGLIDELAGFAGRAKTTVAQNRIDVLGGLTGQGKLHIMHNTGAVDGKPRNEACFHQIDEYRIEPHLDDMGADAEQDGLAADNRTGEKLYELPQVRSGKLFRQFFQEIGEASYFDFRLFCRLVSNLEGGVYVNIGSAVLLPEVFLKSLTVVRNLGYQVSRFTTANFDFLRQYRALTNVVCRPTAEGGRGFHFTGHHEIMIPLFAAAVKERLGNSEQG